MPNTNYYAQLSPVQKAELFKLYVAGGFTSLSSIIDDYNEFKNGGDIHIKESHRGRFTDLVNRTGKSASWYKEHGTPAQRKMATFALNARKWKHDDGGFIDVDEYHDEIDYPVGEFEIDTINESPTTWYDDYMSPQNIDDNKRRISEETVTRKYVDDVMWIMENPHYKGLRKDGKFYAYTDKNADGKTFVNIGPGLERSAHPNIDYSRGYTRKELDDIAYEENLKKSYRITKSLESMEDGAYAGVRDTLSMGPLLVYSDFAHNVVEGKNMPSSYPNFTKAVANGDLDAAKLETYTGSKRRSDMRGDILTYKPITSTTIKNR